jgi:hypothetical protein
VAITSDWQANWPRRGLQLVAAFELLDGSMLVFRCRLGAGLVALGQQHVEDVAGLVIAEQLAELSSRGTARRAWPPAR